MIASLKGIVEDVLADSAVVGVGGVGYLVQASGRTLARLQIGEAVHLLVETQVREGAITLYGFADKAERSWFRLLTGVQGVGGRLGLAILGTLTPDELAQAITLQDKAMLTRAPGVGPRLATRLVTELKGKELPGTLGGVVLPAEVAAPASLVAEARSALLNLGFREAEAERAVATALQALAGQGPDAADKLAVGEVIREALKRAAH